MISKTRFRAIQREAAELCEVKSDPSYDSVLRRVVFGRNVNELPADTIAARIDDELAVLRHTRRIVMKSKNPKNKA